jgi:hypothetical protein
MTLQHLSFNLALSRIAAIGFHRSITAFNLAGAPLPTNNGSVVMKGETAESQPKQCHPQLHRTNKRDWTPATWERYAQRLASKRAYNVKYVAIRRERRRLARLRSIELHEAKLQQTALMLMAES